MPAARPRPLVLVVIDGLTPTMLESAASGGRAPTLAGLLERGTYGRAVSTFPSLTPVCLSSIATGAHPDVHEIPHLVWFNRAEGRLVEYGSSFGALRAAGARRTIFDAVFNMNERHLGPRAVTVFEALEDAGLVTAAVNITCYRGRTRHRPVVPGLGRVAHGPRRFFFYGLIESERTGAPRVLSRGSGSVDAYAAAAGRWLVTRDGFDFFVYYLADYDYASHAAGPDAAHEALERADGAVGTLLEAAGGLDEFLDRYAVVVCSDHGQTRVERVARFQDRFAGYRLARRVPRPDDELVVTASNRAGMVYRLPACGVDARELAALLDHEEAAEIVLFREEDEAVARRGGEELRFAPDQSAWRTSGDASLLDAPDGLARAWAALANPNAGDILVSAAPGIEFADLGGRHHAGGGSHGSLASGDSLVPVATVGTGPPPKSIVDIAPLVLTHFGVEAPPYARPAANAA